MSGVWTTFADISEFFRHEENGDSNACKDLAADRNGL
jgi:hypothetical protein